MQQKPLPCFPAFFPALCFKSQLHLALLNSFRCLTHSKLPSPLSKYDEMITVTLTVVLFSKLSFRSIDNVCKKIFKILPIHLLYITFFTPRSHFSCKPPSPRNDFPIFPPLQGERDLVSRSIVFARCRLHQLIWRSTPLDIVVASKFIALVLSIAVRFLCHHHVSIFSNPIPGNKVKFATYSPT